MTTQMEGINIGEDENTGDVDAVEIEDERPDAACSYVKSCDLMKQLKIAMRAKSSLSR